MALDDVVGDLPDFTGDSVLDRVTRSIAPDLPQGAGADAILNRLNRKLASPEEAEKAKVRRAAKPEVPDLSSYGKPADQREDLSSFGTPADQVPIPQPRPAGAPPTSIGLSGNLAAAAKGIPTGALEATGGALKGSAQAINQAQPYLESLQYDPMGNVIGQAPVQAPAPVENNPLYRAGQAVEGAAPTMSPAERESMGGRLGTMAGGIAPYAAATLAGGPTLGMVAGFTGMAADTYGKVYEDAKAKGATEEQAQGAAGKSAAVAGVLGSLPLGAGKYAQSLAAKVVASSAAFTTMGEAQEALLQQIAKDYDPKAGYTLDQKRLIAELILGAGMGGLHHAFERKPDIKPDEEDIKPDEKKPDERKPPPGLKYERRPNDETKPDEDVTPDDKGPEPEPDHGGPGVGNKPPPGTGEGMGPGFTMDPQTRAKMERVYRHFEPGKNPADLADHELYNAVNEHLRDTSSTGYTAKPETEEEKASREEAATARTEKEALKRRGWDAAFVDAMTPEQRRKYFQEAMAGAATPPPGSTGPEATKSEKTPETATEAKPESGTREEPARPATASDVAALTPAEPSPAQAEAENFRHAHLELEQFGLTGKNSISVETGVGQERKGVGKDGKPWSVTLEHGAYGRIKGTKGADGQPLDVFVGPHPTSPYAFIIDQHEPETGQFDEHKIMLGYRTPIDALHAYANSYTDGGKDRIGHVTAMGPEEFKTWLKGDTTKALKPVQGTGTADSAPATPAPTDRQTNKGGVTARLPLTEVPPEPRIDETPKVAPGGTGARPSEQPQPSKPGNEKSSRLNPGSPLSLLQFIASKGGIAPDQETRALDIGGKHRVQLPGQKGFFGVIRPTGMSLDYMREAAEEAGYLRGEHGKTSTVRDLLDAMDAELRGQKRHAEGEEGTKAKRDLELEKEREEHERERDEATYGDARQAIEDAGYEDLPSDLREAAAKLIVNDGLDPDSAVEQASRQMVDEDSAYYSRMVETALGPDADRVAPVDIARAAELMDEHPGMDVSTAFGHAVIESSVNQHFITPEEAEQAYGEEVQDVLGAGREGPSGRRAPVEPEGAAPKQERAGGAEEARVVPSSGKAGEGKAKPTEPTQANEPAAKPEAAERPAASGERAARNEASNAAANEPAAKAADNADRQDYIDNAIRSVSVTEGGNEAVQAAIDRGASDQELVDTLSRKGWGGSFGGRSIERGSVEGRGKVVTIKGPFGEIKLGGKQLAAAIRRAFPKTEPAAEAPDNTPITHAAAATVIQRIFQGEITADELKRTFHRVVASKDAIKAEIGKKTIRQLAPRGASGYTKAQLVDRVFDNLLSKFNVRGSYSWSPMTETSEAAIARVVDKTTDEDIAKATAERKASAAEFKERYTNPQTLSQFHDYVHAFGKEKLTSEQLKRYDELIAEQNRANAEREQAQKAVVKKVDADVSMELVETKHTQKGHDLFVVKLATRVPAETYSELNSAAKRLGGYYSSYAKGGAVPGFQFKTKDAAEKFMAIREGDQSRADIVQAKQEEVKDNAVDRLRDMAERMTDNADESLSADRKVNTARRARIAAGAEARAAADKALATSMRNVADAIESGEAKHLGWIRTRADVEMLDELLRGARRNWVEAQKPATYGEREKLEQKAISEEMVDKSTYPFPYAHRETAEKLARATANTTGVKMAARRLMKEARNAQVAKEWRVQAKHLGMLEDLRVVAEAAAKKPDTKWDASNVLDSFDDYNRLKRLGINDLPSLRAALREYLKYRGAAAKVDPIKAAERALIGRKIPGYFPTPEPLVDRMIEKADIKLGDKVLEPSAGKGNIADKLVTAAGPENVDVVEPVADLRSILKSKGHNIVGSDFTEMSESGFTYGDVFRAPDGTLGIMQGSGGIGSGRVGFDRIGTKDNPFSGSRSWYDRSELEPVEKRGVNSGYDKIVMNPPFEDRQDVEHVRRAYDLLKPGGRLVAIMSEGPFFGNDKRAEDFRFWLNSVGGISEKNPEGSFKDSENPTGVNTRMVVVNKPAGAPRLKNYGWDRVKLSDAYSLEQLNNLRNQVIAEHSNPGDKTGRYLENGRETLHLYDQEGRKKLDALAWAVTHKLKEKAPTTEKGPDNKEQLVIPGAEKASDKTMAQRAANAPLKPKTAQKGSDFGLFGDEHKQTDLMDMLGKKPSLEQAAHPDQLSLLDYAAPDTGKGGGLGRTAQAHVLALGRETKTEHLIAYDANGDKVDNGKMQGTSRAIAIDPKFLDRLHDPNEAIVIHHNHPVDTNTSFSASDLAIATLPGTHAVWAHAHNGDIYRIEVLPRAKAVAPKAWRDRAVWADRIVNNIKEGIIPSLQKAWGQIDKVEAERLWGHLVQVVLSDAGFSKYSANVDDEAFRASVPGLNEAMEQMARVLSERLSNVPTSRVHDRRAQPIRHPGEVGTVFDRDQVVAPNAAAQSGHQERGQDHRGEEGAQLAQDSHDNTIADILGTRLLGKLGELNATEIRTQLQDKFIRVRHAEESVGAPASTYQAESLYYGRTGQRLESLNTHHIEPLIRDMKARDIDLDKLDNFLKARHAPERNAAMGAMYPAGHDFNEAVRNPSVKGGSGWSNNEAARVIARIRREGKLPDYQAVAAKVDALNYGTRRRLYDAGLISRETFEAWNSAYRYYVPLRGFAEGTEDEAAMARQGAGYNIRGKEAKQAFGRRSEAASPLAYSIMQAEMAVIRAEKVKVGQTFLQFVRANPDPRRWVIDRPEEIRRLDPNTGLVTTVPNNLSLMADNVFSTKVDGRTVNIRLLGPDGVNLARALKNMGAANVHKLIRVYSTLTHTMAKLATSFNPDFMIPNLARDFGEAFINLQAQDQRRFVRNFVKHMPGAMAGSMAAIAGKSPAKLQRYVDAFHRFDKAGGRVRFFGIDDPDRIETNVTKKLKRLQKSPLNTIKDIGDAAAHALEVAGGGIENATRLASFMAAEDAGMSTPDAAMLARNLTVDFNKKGELGGAISALYMFANAGIQGQARMIRAMGSRRVWAAVGALAGASALSALYSILMSDKDEAGVPDYIKIPPWERDKNLIFMLGGHNYLKIPLPYGFSPFAVLGAHSVNVLMGHEKPLAAASAIIHSITDAFNPLGEESSLVADIVPSAARPLYHIEANKNWTGKPLYPEQDKFKGQKPNSTQSFKSDSGFSKEAALQLNKWSGGDTYTSGAIDVHPGSIDHVLQAMGGGVAKFVMNLSASLYSGIKGEEWQPEKTPILRRFVGKVGEDADRYAYYDKRQEVMDKKAAVDQARKDLAGPNKDAASAYLKDNPQAGLQAEVVKRTDSQLKSLRAQEERIKNSAMGDAEKRLATDTIHARMRSIENRARATLQQQAR